ncbi:MAG TPA: LytTR family DNA-binding domain-containing protein [Flavipsychrobacter sp.]
MISAVLIDSEPKAITRLEKLIRTFCREIKIAGHATSANESISLINGTRPNLVFLDVADDNVFDIFHKIDNIDFAIIAVSAFRPYAKQAIQFNVADYLLKPVKPDALVAAVKKVGEISSADHLIEDGSTPGEIVGKPFTKIGLRTSKGTVYIALDNIIRLESSDNYTHVHTGNGGKYLITKTLKSFELILPPVKFIRCHQSHMVNLSHIEAYDKVEGSNLVMCNEHVVPVSRANRSRLEQVLNRMYPHV